MSAPILVTTFAPWKAHQTSNSSDDLLLELVRRRSLPENGVLMRQIPVHFQLAPCQVIAKIVELRPAVVVCCGMAETRRHLSLEQYGHCTVTGRRLQTGLDLPELMRATRLTEISYSAGTYVCNHLFFQVLDFIERQQWPTQGLFIHIPRLTPENRELLVMDMATVLQRLSLVRAVAQVTKSAH